MMVVTPDGIGKVIGVYGDQTMVHVQIGKRYSAYRMYTQAQMKPVL